MRNKKYAFVCLLFSFSLLFFGQSISELPSGYRTIRLGMDLESVKQELAADSLFNYRGERDVSLLPDQERQLIEVEGHSFIQKAWFQFIDGKLYAITLQMDETKLDYGSFFKTLSEKYGKPQHLSPEQTSWENEVLRMSLERPLSLKYLDLKVYNVLLDKSRVDAAAFEITRELFLESF
ncbi:MAG TPA: hypothetical protein PLR81_08685 [Treponemataceae bacterium]|nr:hypothetical protein [Treponemataceae bacterium]